MSEQSLLVFSDDWGRHPSSCQHLIRCLLDDFAVNWVNTIGMRPPRLSWSTMSRGVEKMRQWCGRSDDVPFEGDDAIKPNVRNPLMWPWFRTTFDRSLNRRLLLRQLRDCRGIPHGVTTVPIIADAMESLDVGSWTYYCVDDWSTWVGLDHKPLADMELKVLQLSNRIVAASETLQDRLSGLGFESDLLTHGVDLEQWQRPAKTASIEFLNGLEKPLVVQWGMINQNLDIESVGALAEQMTQGTIVFVGPEVDVDPALERIDRVRRFPKIPYGDLPRLAEEASVLIMAYLANPGTVASQPLKLKEYMATGKPVVARRIPATEQWSDAVDLYGTADEFASHVMNRLSASISEVQVKARSRLSSESWQEKADKFRSIFCKD